MNISKTPKLQKIMLGLSWIPEFKLGPLFITLFFLFGIVPYSFAQVEVIKTDDSGTGSLRWAIDQVNLSSQAETISFNIPGAGPHTIQLLSPLDPVQTEVSFSMSNQEGFNDLPVIVLDGSQLSSGNGLQITASGSTVNDLCIINFPGHGVFINGADNATIRGNFLGIKPDGETAAGNELSGLYVEASSQLLISDNLISGNSEEGIFLKGVSSGGVSDVVENEIVDNTIGTNLQSTIPIGNGGNGIKLERSSGNAIFYNLISGNGFQGSTGAGSGILLNFSLSTGNIIGGNLIGLARNGIDAIGNAGNGISLNAASSNTIGDVFGDGDFNYISGNLGAGITLIQSSNTNTVVGNIIGEGTDGMTTVPNGNSGINIVGSSNNKIGGTNSIESNLIANNSSDGIRIEEFLGTNSLGNEILGNSIYSNVEQGIDLGSDGVTSNDDMDPDTGVHNLQNYPELVSTSYDEISNEVTVTYSLSSDPSNSEYPVRIEFFSVNSSERQGQELLGADSYTATDYASGEKTVSFTIPTGISFETGDRIVATATDNQGNSSEFSETIFEEIVLGPEDFVVVNTDDSGEGSFRQVIENVNRSSEAKTITFDIQDPGPHIIQPLSIYNSFNNTVIIDGTSQPGYSDGNPMIVLDGSLVSDESGIEFTGAADNSSVLGLSIINFDNSGIFTIGDEITIQGNFIGIGPDGVAGPNGTGISMLNSVNNQIGGVLPGDRNVISGNNVGIDFEPGSGQSVVEGNFIGTDPDGTQALGNKFNVQIRGSIENRIGGSTPEQRNIIAGAFFEQTDGVRTGGSGVVLTSGTTTSNTTVNSTANIITGNYIGTDVTGEVSLANERGGVLLLFGSSGNRIGGESSGERNIISGNGQYGVYLQGSENSLVNNNLIQGNFIGVDVTGSSSLPNDVGVWLLEENNSNIIGTDGSANGGNVISGNNNAGIVVIEGENNIIRGNLIGTDAQGGSAISNSIGIEIRGAGGTVGGTTPGSRNVISGNSSTGLYLNEAVNVSVTGNYVGLDNSGENAIEGQSQGIRISGGSDHKITGNTISGNEGYGVRIDNSVQSGAGAENVVVSGNMIGPDPSGLVNIGNVRDGIILIGSSNNIIGGETEADRNIISGNGGGFEGFFVRSTGIFLTSASNNNTVIGNYIGSNNSGEFVQEFGNSSHGILIDSGSSGNVIGLGQDGSGIGNVITGNGINVNANGITISDNSLQNRISGNQIFSNGAIGIDLENDGITANDDGDSDTGPNELQNYPEIVNSIYDSAAEELKIEYSVSSDIAEIEYPLTIEFYLDDGTRQGKVLLGSDTYESANAGNLREIVIPLTDASLISIGDNITSVAISNDGNTSEFSALSTVSNVLTIPGAVTLLSPANNATDVSVLPVLSWELIDNADSYDLQVSTNSGFTTTVTDLSNLTQTNAEIGPLAYEIPYYWRVRAINGAGAGVWSQEWSFTTEAEPLSPPDVVTLLSPANQSQDVELNPTLEWAESANASSYSVQLSAGDQFTSFVVNEENVEELTIAVENLEGLIQYFWRVKAVNSEGESDWSEAWSFTTMEATSTEEVDFTLPETVELSQNYPNPFNPITQIEVALPASGNVKLQIFDMLGREVGIVVDQRMAAGRYTFSFDASALTSGTYIYRIEAGSEVRTRKMTLIK